MNHQVSQRRTHDEPSTLSERLFPFLQDADRALAENSSLRQHVAQLTHELNYTQSLHVTASNRVEFLERELAVASRESALFKARMKMFGEAANAIVEEVTQDARKPQRDAYRPTREHPVRPVQERIPDPEAYMSPALMFLNSQD